MSIMMSMDFDQDIEQPPEVSQWYCQVLFEYIYEVDTHAGAVPNILGRLVEHFEVNIDPLLRVAGQDFSIEEYGGNKEAFESAKNYNQACWQSPQILIDCLQTLVDKLDSEPDVFSRLEISEEFSEYFSQGYFKRELLDLIRLAKWARENNIENIRLWAA